MWGGTERPGRARGGRREPGSPRALVRAGWERAGAPGAGHVEGERPGGGAWPALVTELELGTRLSTRRWSPGLPPSRQRVAGCGAIGGGGWDGGVL